MSGLEDVIERSRINGFPLAVLFPDGRRIPQQGEARFTVRAHNEAGLRALASLNVLPLSEAYMRGDLEFEGDLVRAVALWFKELGDPQPLIKAWRWLAPRLFGRARFNPSWIAKHYDSGNIQLLAADRDWHIYTPGIYDRDDDTLEGGAQRKLAFAFEQLRLVPGAHLLEIGCGWGGMTRYSARRGVKVTGVTLSRDQFDMTNRLVADEGLDARALYQDFFTFEPAERFDAINMMGVIEDLSDYPQVMRRVARWLKPGGRVYLDFASSIDKVATSSFITKHIWPGAFRMVYMPQFVTAVVESPLEIATVWNDRRNYHLWAAKVHDRWVERREEAIHKAGEEAWRMMRVLFAGTAGVMDSPHHDITAFRVLLELPVDTVRAGAPG
jgi:cyclopropane-fatty-acyl-phospholipid synthase